MNGLLCDADFLLAFVLAAEPNHTPAKRIAALSAEDSWHMLDVVMYECANVASRKYDQRVAAQMVDFLKAASITMHRAAMAEAEAWEMFVSQPKKNISFVDCANIVTARKYGWKIASFDAFYPKALRVG